MKVQVHKRLSAFTFICAEDYGLISNRERCPPTQGAFLQLRPDLRIQRMKPSGQDGGDEQDTDFIVSYIHNELHTQLDLVQLHK